IKPGMGNFSLVRMFRAGQQTPVRIVINKLRTSASFFQKLDAGLEADSLSFATAFYDTNYLRILNLTPSQMPAVIVPATYEIWWNATPQQVAEKFKKAYMVFWSDARRKAADAMGLSVPEVVTVASIVEEETNQDDEKAMVASVYLNRLRKGMKLDADPTVKFAVGDFSLRRILHVHTSFESPYNTYRVLGLPPGPICTPGKSSIEAVLKNEASDYLFFCAKEDFSGHHNFANTYEAHLKNASLYQDALNKRGIR
ncbi:MAG: endolytic transglycosylase MltG, partial [Chitinophagaceae bacterium]|nr:endolytic transglycosylase MltG [Chitinophagaceae bacterium]